MQDRHGAREDTGNVEDMLRDSRRRTLELVGDLDEEQMMGPQLKIVNPPLWEIGHLAWFQEYWNLRRRDGTRDEFSGSEFLERPDEIYNSAEIDHDSRWGADLLSTSGTHDYMQNVLDRTLDRLDREGGPELSYYSRLATFHEDMHAEAFTYTRHTHGLPAPELSDYDPHALDGQPTGPLPGDAEIPGGEFMLGADPGSVERGEVPFVFDNEKWAHPVQVAPFKMARGQVTYGQFAEFVESGGYEKPGLWSEAGWRWREENGIERPLYWEKRGTGDGEWHRRHFDRLEPIPENAAVIHVGYHEAEAYCNWAGRRLPTEAEWELAAAAEPAPDGGISSRKRLYPWGDKPPVPGDRRANLDGILMGTVDVAAFPEGESAFGVRQMLGNVWEWCSDVFQPYPGYERDPYKEYSEPWFGDHMVLRGGCWATRSRMLRNTWRNFYMPDRRDTFVGFRTCAR
ncbi:selenoneine synthase SenA [Rubrobacter aplysinae]|uniref:selenoneine synthase SenA n=1 Tax=Rubrobacter aplysinae TaxID=909625 RepID=UPI000AF9916B|nr:selenoneine synthase SenA [Rubrobacter aplysinae]